MEKEILDACFTAHMKRRDLLENDSSLSQWANQRGIPKALFWFSEIQKGYIDNTEDSQLGGVCESCDKTLSGEGEIHHYPIPKRKGGETVLTNVILLCKKCHTIIEDSR